MKVEKVSFNRSLIKQINLKWSNDFMSIPHLINYSSFMVFASVYSGQEGPFLPHPSTVSLFLTFIFQVRFFSVTADDDVNELQLTLQNNCLS